MHIGLVAGVEDDRVARRVEDSVHGQRQFDDAQVGAQVPTGGRDIADQKLPQLLAQASHLFLAELGEVLRSLNRVQNGHPHILPS